MALRIGQKRNIDAQSSSSYMTSIKNDFTASTVQSLNPFVDDFADESSNSYFSDYCLKKNNNSYLSVGAVYYLVLKIKKPIQHDQVKDNLYYIDSEGGGHSYDEISFSLLLQENDYYEDKDDDHPVQKISVQPYHLGKSTTQDNAYFYLDVVFTPLIDTYNSIVLKMNRNYYDAIKEERKYFLDGGVQEGTSPVEYQIYTLLNIMGNESYWTKMGIQTRPGTLIIINKEPIRVGRSGIYELNNGTKITSFMMAAPPSMDGSESNPEINPYLLDYIYEEGSQQ